MLESIIKLERERDRMQKGKKGEEKRQSKSDVCPLESSLPSSCEIVELFLEGKIISLTHVHNKLAKTSTCGLCAVIC